MFYWPGYLDGSMASFQLNIYYTNVEPSWPLKSCTHSSSMWNTRASFFTSTLIVLVHSARSTSAFISNPTRTSIIRTGWFAGVGRCLGRSSGLSIAVDIDKFRSMSTAIWTRTHYVKVLVQSCRWCRKSGSRRSRPSQEQSCCERGHAGRYAVFHNRNV